MDLRSLGKATQELVKLVIGSMVGKDALCQLLGYRENAGAPTLVVPSFIGEKLLDTTNSIFYRAYGVAAGEWAPDAAATAAKFEVVTTTNVITEAENGKTFYLNAATGFVSTLPAPALGLKYRFVVGATAPTSGNHTIVTDDSANVIKGGLAGAEVDDTSDFDSIADGDTISFVANSALSGAWAEVESDGTNWYVSGWASLRASLTLTQASA